MIRAFIALEIDQLHKQKLTELISCLKKSNADVKWVNENQMHFTLKFLGNIEKDMVHKISNILKSIVNDFKTFTIQFSKIGVFPNMRRPRVVWIGIAKGSDSLRLLNDKIETHLEGLGFQREKREYKAHLTLGRVRSSKNIGDLTKLIEEVDFESQDDIKIDKLILFQSTLTPKGAIYTPLLEFPL